jgi:hypothetical protein
VNGTVMPAEWRDSTDTAPSAARTARTVRGHRSYDPLRRCFQRHGEHCGITERHILAADRLRAFADGAAIGFSVPRDLTMPVTQILYRPATGPTKAAERQAKCWRHFVRTRAIFTADQRQLLTHTLLMNGSVASWCKRQHDSGQHASAHQVMGQLVALLDLLEKYFSSEIDAELERGVTA